VLTTLSHVKLGNLSNIRSIDAGFLTTRAWGTLRAVVQGVAPTKAAAAGSALAVRSGGIAGPEFIEFVVAPSPRSSGPWVGSVMDRPQPLDSDVGIELRGGERSVTEQFLDAP